MDWQKLERTWSQWQEEEDYPDWKQSVLYARPLLQRLQEQLPDLESPDCSPFSSGAMRLTWQKNGGKLYLYLEAEEENWWQDWFLHYTDTAGEGHTRSSDGRVGEVPPEWVMRWLSATDTDDPENWI